MTDQPDNIILLTGFGPFGEFTINPTEQIVRELNGTTINGYLVKGVVLPVVFGEAGDALLETIELVNPVVVICLGLAGDRNDISIERLAVNLDDARIPDNAGRQPVDQPVAPGGPDACWSTLPVKTIKAALDDAGIAASLSLSAGSFVCNHVFYRLLRHLDGKGRIRAGFLHVPQASGMGGERQSLTLDRMLEAVQIALATTLKA